MANEKKGERLAAVRLQLKLSQKALGEAVNKSPGSISAMEVGTVDVSGEVEDFLASLKPKAVNLNWLRTGVGTMFLESEPVSAPIVEPWKDEAFNALKSKNETLENALGMAYAMLESLGIKPKLGKLKVFGSAESSPVFINNQGTNPGTSLALVG